MAGPISDIVPADNCPRNGIGGADRTQGEITMNKEALYRALTVALPIVAVTSGMGASIYEWQRLKRLEADTSAAEKKLTQIDLELRNFEAQPQSNRFPTVDKTPREQALFLDALRANADVCRVQLIRWTNSTPPAPPPSSTPSDKPANGLPGGVTPIISMVEVAGRAENTRQFLYNVIRTRRLLNLSDIKWVRDQWPNTHLTFTLTRYVAPPIHNPALPNAGPANGADPNSPGAGRDQRAESAVTPAGYPVGTGPKNGMVLPNPMDAPGIAHGAYQSGTDAVVSQLNEVDQSKKENSPRQPAVTNSKR
jgi:hypothetical protein